MAMYFPDLIAEYKQSLKELQEADGCASMIRDMKESIQWMETGYDPAEYRAATRTDAYVMDHHLMQDLIMYVDAKSYIPDWMLEHQSDDMESPDDTWDYEVVRIANMKNKIKNALYGLTANERAAFVMIRAERMTFAKVARIMGVNRGTVQNYVKRAETKINDNVSEVKEFLFAV